MTDKKVKKEPKSWDDFVRQEVNALLDMYLATAKNGNVGIRYRRVVTGQYETGPVYDESKADAVAINLVFEFEKPIDISVDE